MAGDGNLKELLYSVRKVSFVDEIHGQAQQQGIQGVIEQPGFTSLVDKLSFHYILHLLGCGSKLINQHRDAYLGSSLN